MISNGYVRLSNNFIPKKLENNYILDKRSDELYELNDSAFDFILKCDGSRLLSDLNPSKRFFNFLLKNSIIEIVEKPKKRNFIVNEPPKPTLRYLEIQLTNACNLNCLHCYQSEKKFIELDINLLKKVLNDFIKIQGLRIILSGGEPLLYSKLDELNKFLKDYPARVVLLTNGTLIKNFDVSKWNFDEIQISIDGLEESHDFIRGIGCFKKLIEGIEYLKSHTKIDISFATMIHKKNLKDFPKIKKLAKKYNIKEWGIDYPVITGNLLENREIVPSIEESLKCFRYRFGASFHSTDENNPYACGTHLMTLSADGFFLPCGFFQEKVYGNIKDGLINAIKNRNFFKLDEIMDCKDCDFILDCRGGCRYRAGDIKSKDIIMCKIFGKT